MENPHGAAIAYAQTIDVAPLVVSPAQTGKMLSLGLTRVYELINAREIESFLVGKSRKITVASIHAYIARKKAAADEEKRKTPRRKTQAA